MKRWMVSESATSAPTISCDERIGSIVDQAYGFMAEIWLHGGYHMPYTKLKVARITACAQYNNLTMFASCCARSCKLSHYCVDGRITKIGTCVGVTCAHMRTCVVPTRRSMQIAAWSRQATSKQASHTPINKRRAALWYAYEMTRKPVLDVAECRGGTNRNGMSMY